MEVEWRLGTYRGHRVTEATGYGVQGGEEATGIWRLGGIEARKV
jgi:hypothetical protein